MGDRGFRIPRDILNVIFWLWLRDSFLPCNQVVWLDHGSPEKQLMNNGRPSTIVQSRQNGEVILYRPTASDQHTSPDLVGARLGLRLTVNARKRRLPRGMNITQGPTSINTDPKEYKNVTELIISIPMFKSEGDSVITGVDR